MRRGARSEAREWGLLEVLGAEALAATAAATASGRRGPKWRRRRPCSADTPPPRPQIASASSCTTCGLRTLQGRPLATMKPGVIKGRRSEGRGQDVIRQVDECS